MMKKCDLKRIFSKTLLSALTCVFLFASGCATAPYQYGSRDEYVKYKVPYREGYYDYLQSLDIEPQITYGRPIPWLDKTAGWIWPGSLLGKLVLWNYKVDNHEISPETVQILKDYLEANELDDVQVRINQYAVGREWGRMRRNCGMSPWWKYNILGLLSMVQYTIFPGRFFGGDHYNPYSNTINLYSDIPAIALHEAGHAKDFAYRYSKGAYALAYGLPFFNLYAEARATQDAQSYLLELGDPYLRKQGYNILYPAYGTYIGGDIGNWFLTPWNYAFYAAGVIPGHIVGRIKSAGIDEDETVVVEEEVEVEVTE